ncbi:adenosylcobinamide-GDP ribazoletransferase [Candidatus Bathyarchaeota archaeon]|nr:adenosylcobinamide-GDP ribazoletransferase [Candidatus Bathyarchaeota archaeon]
MKILKEFKSAIAFLTIFPVNEGSLIDAINGMYFFPIIGAMIGFTAGIFSLLISHFLSRLLTSLFTLGLLLLITGLHHLDGLADFGDGVMASGVKEDKLKAMRDVNLGIGGLTLTTLVTLSSIFAIYQLNFNFLLQTLIASETSAKLSMVFLALISKPAYNGLGASFIKGMKGKKGLIRFFLALITSAIIIFLTFSFFGILILISGLITSLILFIISNTKFGGVTGDILGALNEISRMLSLVIAGLVV